MIEPSAAATAGTWEAASRPMRRVGHAIEVHDSIGSTNDRARDLLAAPDGDGRVVVAEEQTAGRGRRGRDWLSPPGLNLLVSVALRPRLAAVDAWQLGLAAALAASDACAGLAPVALKWPNDLVGGGDARKLGGLLVETMADGDRLSGAVVGVGINANWRRAAMPADLRGTATSLADLAGAPVDRVVLLGRLLAALEAELEAIEAGRSPLERYRARCSTLGRAVTVATADRTIIGRAVDLDPAGALVVEAGDGRHVISSGEVVRVAPGSGA
jgi:BirA family transcriptional regulator, biotin operon repressor / biotin---[acetyl-CoA-carboxylase] ligase